MKKPLLSMTGFAALQTEISGKSIRMELRSLNHRFQDIKIRVPKEFSAIELPLRNWIRSHFSRGVIEYRMEYAKEPTQTLAEYSVDFGVAAHYYETLVRLGKTLGLEEKIQVRDLLGLPDVMKKNGTGDFPSTSEELWACLQPPIENVTSALKKMREEEGSSIARSI